MNKKIYLFLNRERQGPFTTSEIKQKLIDGVVSTKDLAFVNGMEDWQPIGEIESLNFDLKDESSIANVFEEKKKEFVDKAHKQLNIVVKKTSADLGEMKSKIKSSQLYSNLQSQRKEIPQSKLIEISNSCITFFHKKLILLRSLLSNGDKKINLKDFIDNYSPSSIKNQFTAEKFNRFLKNKITLSCILFFLLIGFSLLILKSFVSNKVSTLTGSINASDSALTEWKPADSVNSLAGSEWEIFFNKESEKEKYYGVTKIEFEGKAALLTRQNDGKVTTERFEFDRELDLKKPFPKDGFMVFEFYREYETTRTSNVFHRDVVSKGTMIHLAPWMSHYDDDYIKISLNREEIPRDFHLFLKTKTRVEIGVERIKTLATPSLILVNINYSDSTRPFIIAN